MGLIEDLGFIPIIVAIVVIILIVLVTLFETKLSKKIIVSRNKRDLFYKAQFEAIDKSSPEKQIQGLDAVARNFFAEAFNINKKDYSEFSKIFKKQNKKDEKKFSDIMTQLTFSQEKNPNEVAKAHELLGKIMSNTHILQPFEKEQLAKTKQLQGKKEEKSKE